MVPVGWVWCSTYSWSVVPGLEALVNSQVVLPVPHYDLFYAGLEILPNHGFCRMLFSMEEAKVRNEQYHLG